MVGLSYLSRDIGDGWNYSLLWLGSHSSSKKVICLGASRPGATFGDFLTNLLSKVAFDFGDFKFSIVSAVVILGS